MDQKNGEFCLLQSIRKLPEKYGKVLFYKTYFEESNISWKSLIWSEDKIITEFRKQNGLVWFLVKCTKTARKVRNGVILQNLLRRE